jgi:hypothetical protein
LRVSVAAIALTLATAFWWGTWALLAMRRAGWLSSLTVALLLIGLLFFDLSATGAYTDISSTPPTGGFDHPALIDYLRHTPDVGRIDSRTDIDALWQPDSAALYGLADVAGIANPLLLDHWQQLWEALGGRQSRLYDMLHATHVLVRDGTPLPEKFVLDFDAPGELALYRNQSALPRAWLVHAATAASDTAAAIAALTAATFDPQTQAVIQSDTAELPPLTPATAPETVQTVAQQPNALTLQVNASAPGLVVISDVWYPGWRATVNGAAAPVEQVNLALRGVAVPAGVSTVELWFAPDSWRIGLLAAAVGWLLLIAIFVFEKRKAATVL